jgi:hypothetical protein
MRDLALRLALRDFELERPEGVQLDATVRAA